MSLSCPHCGRVGISDCGCSPKPEDMRSFAALVEAARAQPNPGQTHFQGCWRDPRHHACAEGAVERLMEVVEAFLLFHDGGYWDAPKASRWKSLTGSEEATTKVLCDFARQVMALCRPDSKGSEP